jgi:hypothetical protein
MFMRYFGGGIGHLRQGLSQEATYDMDVDSEPEEDSICQPHARDPPDAHSKTLESLAESLDQTAREVEVDEEISGSESGSDFDSNATGSDCDSDGDDRGLEDGENSDNNGYASF